MRGALPLFPVYHHAVVLRHMDNCAFTLKSYYQEITDPLKMRQR